MKTTILGGGGGWGVGGWVKLIYLRTRPQVNKKVPKYTGLFGIWVGVGGGSVLR